MYLFDSIQADVAYETIARTFIAGAPTEEKAEAARDVFSRAEGWRVVARCLAELSPLLLRRGDPAALANALRSTIPQFYYEMEKPPERREKVEALSPYVQL